MRPTLLIALILLGCQPGSSTPPPNIALVGARVQMSTTPRPVFDAARPPTVRIDGPLPKKIRLRLVGPGSSPDVRFDVLKRPPAIFLRAAPTLVPEHGEGAVEVWIGRTRVARWPVRWSKSPDRHPAVTAVRDAPTLAAAQAALASAHQSPAWIRAAAHLALAPHAPPAERIQAWRTAGDAALATGTASLAAHAWREAARIARAQRDFVQASRLLERAAAIDHRLAHAAGRAETLYARAHLAEDLGEPQRAEHLYRATHQQARHLAHDPVAMGAACDLSRLLIDLERPHAALATLQAVAAEATQNPSTGAMHSAALAWVELNAALAGQSSPAHARATLADARQRARHHGTTAQEAQLALHQALLAEHLNDTPGAKTHLTEAQQLGLRGPALRLSRRLQAQVALRTGRLDDAQRRFKLLADLGDAAPDTAWRAWAGLGHVAYARGHHRRALEQFRHARRARRRVADRLAFATHRTPFTRDDQALTHALIRLHLAANSPARAFEALDEAQARAPRTLAGYVQVGQLAPRAQSERRSAVIAYRQERARFEASEAEGDLRIGPALQAWRARRMVARTRLAERFDALTAGPPPAATHAPTLAQALGAGESLITFSQIGPIIHGFRLTPNGQVAHKTSEPGADLLGDWHPSRTGDAHVYIVPGDVAHARQLGLDGIPPLISVAGISTLPFAGLLLRLDAPPRGEPVLVINPGTDQPAIRTLEQHLQMRWPNATRLSGANATLAALLSASANTQLLHFTGHSDLRTEDPWRAGLSLAGGQRLTLPNVLAHQHRMGTVVLTGGDRPAPTATGLSLPHAFLIAGARTVLATRRPLRAADAAPFLRAFYQANGAQAPGPALRVAIAESRRKGDGVWNAFYLAGRP